ncbi:hypothetical protein UFOVP257_195 [uncultured Caudovirales phage]|uniref:Uncharacterized protein n=1 Tax=uncultured Caudovirales phage TaxID=2100421 RepID=A0A6J5LJD7_9CAUD|nr:hypothetical protein UFOVP257_195 [uncultured Caudovirales phage]
MDTTFDLNLSIVLRSIWWKDIPIISYGIDDLTINTMPISNRTTITMAGFPLSIDKHCVWIDFNNKDDSNCVLEERLDMAVEIESVTLEGITLDRVKWAAEYYPRYPEPWASTQTNLPTVVKYTTYLGWNGRWNLNFTVPIFTWIHQTENLGWIYYPQP